MHRWLQSSSESKSGPACFGPRWTVPLPYGVTGRRRSRKTLTFSFIPRCGGRCCHHTVRSSSRSAPIWEMSLGPLRTRWGMNIEKKGAVSGRRCKIAPGFSLTETAQFREDLLGEVFDLAHVFAVAPCRDAIAGEKYSFPRVDRGQQPSRGPCAKATEQLFT